MGARAAGANGVAANGMVRLGASIGLVGAAAAFSVGAGYVIGHSGSAYLGFALSVVTGFVLVALLRLDELVAASIVAIGIIIDSYQLVAMPGRLPLAGIAFAGFLVALLFVTQSPIRPWVRVPNLGLWALLLVLAALEIPRGVLFDDGLKYFATTLVNAALLYIIGTQIARDLTRFKWLLVAVGAFAVLMAIHTIIQGLTGVFLLITPQWSAWLNYKGGYAIGGSTMRAGSFFINPDDNGVFMAMMLPILVGLAGGLRTRIWRLAAAAGAALVFLGLFFTYSNASWLAVGAGGIVYVLLVARGQSRAFLVLGAFLGAAVIITVFPGEYQALLAHATRAREVNLRLGAWETGLRVVQAFPLTGLGLGYQNYAVYAEPFRVPLQDTVLKHPHDSLLEVAAMAGLPVALIWLVILVSAFRRGIRLLLTLEKSQRALVGGAVVALFVVTVNSLATPAWTLPSQVIPDWLVLGAVSSPALARALLSQGAGTSRGTRPVAAAPWKSAPAPLAVATGDRGSPEAASEPSVEQRLRADKALR